MSGEDGEIIKNLREAKRNSFLNRSPVASAFQSFSKGNSYKSNGMNDGDSF